MQSKIRFLLAYFMPFFLASSLPMHAGAQTCFKEISIGFSYTEAIKTDGTLWAWGMNSNGRIGDGTNNGSNSPVRIGNALNWSKVSAGGYHTVAIKTDGTLWAWGFNFYYQISGDGISKSSPVQFGTETNWASISAGSQYFAGIKKDGTLWLWGSNNYGQLGNETTVGGAYSPSQVITGGTWSSVSCGDLTTAAIKSDGTLWLWGINYPTGCLGDGTNINRSSPVQVLTGGTWKTVSGGSQSFNAIKTDGTLWSWGYGDFGTLGNNRGGNNIYISSPVQVLGGGQWSVSVIAGMTAAGIKTDGTLWTWGNNTTGQLGNNTKIHRSSPVQTTLVDNLWYKLGAMSYGLNPIGTGVYQPVALRKIPTYYLYYSGDAAYISGTTVTDESDRANTGTMSPASIYQTGCPGYFRFNGTTDMINSTWIHYASDINIFTLSVWVRTTDTSGRKIIGRENIATGTGATSYDRQLWIGNNGLPYFGINSVSINGTTTVADGSWHHIIGTFSPNDMKLYVDGVQVSSSTSVASGENVNGYWRVGVYKLTGWPNGSDGYFTGDMTKIAVYPTALTGSDVTTLYNTQFAEINCVKFSYTGSLQTWTVPSGVYSIDATIIGAKGGNTSLSSGGAGAILNTTLDVTPGQIFYLVVGGHPGVSTTPAYGFGGAGSAVITSGTAGAAGGGLSGIFTGAEFLPSQVIAIAAGGGGANGKASNTGGGDGGSPNGSNGGEYNGSFGANAGYGALPTQAGNAGSQFDAYTKLPQQGSYLNGGAGAIGVANQNQGAGGGAGYYGGGGGASGGDATGGAGGGSSYAVGTALYPSIKNTTGNGSITISYGCSYTVGQNILWAWGNNTAGNIGDGTVTNKSLPIPVEYNATWSNIGGV